MPNKSISTNLHSTVQRNVGTVICFKEINFIQKGLIKLIKNNNKDL